MNLLLHLTIVLVIMTFHFGLSCPNGWIEYMADGTCLKIFGKEDRSKRLNWFKAREACHSVCGDLVEIYDEDKNSFVYAMFQGERTGAWIGIRNHASRGYEFKYLDGSDLGNYHPWRSGHPTGDRYRDYKCVGMYTTIDDPGKWVDTYCFDTGPYVCSIHDLMRNMAHRQNYNCSWTSTLSD